MDNDRQSKIAAILAKDVQQLRILTHRLPAVRSFHKAFDSADYYTDSGHRISREEMDKDKYLFPSDFISSVVIVYPIGTDVAAHLKNEKKAHEQKPEIRSPASLAVGHSNRSRI